LQWKENIPNKLQDKAADWREWKDDVISSLDDSNPGMGKLLRGILENTEGAPTHEFIKDYRAELGATVADDHEQIYRALNKLTLGEAKKVLRAVKSENGFVAWCKLHMNFELSLVSQIGDELSDLGALNKKVAKDPK
jgi:hypothetical protein